MKRRTSASRRTSVTTQRKQKRKGNNELAHEVIGIVLFLIALLSFLSLFGISSGILGSFLRDVFHFLSGTFAIVTVLFVAFLGLHLCFTNRFLPKRKGRLISFIILYILLLSLYHDYSVDAAEALDFNNILDFGGVFAAVLVYALQSVVGRIGTPLVIIGAIIIDILLITHWSVSHHAQTLEVKSQKKFSAVHQKLIEKRNLMKKAPPLMHVLTDKPKDFIYQKNNKDKSSESIHSSTEITYKEHPAGHSGESSNEVQNEGSLLSDEPAEESSSPVVASAGFSASQEEAGNALPVQESPENVSHMDQDEEIPPAAAIKEGGHEEENPETDTDQNEDASLQKPDDASAVNTYQFPPLSLLKEGHASVSNGTGESNKAQLLESTLDSFGVKAKVLHVSVGPTVTRYELEPGPGVRVSKIENLADDIALQLAATHIRIEAPIPGKSAVGIEVPNAKVSEVLLRDVLSSSEFKNSKGHIEVALGKDISGHPVVTDLSKMPHLLIAGSTGSGKSVCINGLIISLLYKYRPDEVKMILVDPKVVELSVYNGIPHLRTEVITDPKKAAGALHWAVTEMENRYKLFSRDQVRDITGFNHLHEDEKLPYLLIIIDELADLMMVAGDSVEASIARLAQKARAAGIHMVLATQRPSADVITGLIKANIPSRISFAVSSQIDSRIILDQSGAEQLIGKGDMLFKPIGVLTPIRIQGAFISDGEVEKVTQFVKNETFASDTADDEEPVDLSIPEKKDSNTQADIDQDELLSKAVEWVLDTKRASVSSLQRRFRIGYTRAGRLMDTMESLGIVGPSEGAKPRSILKTWDEARTLISSKKDRQND